MVTFETKVWEKDWEFILKGNYLSKIIKRCNYPFSSNVVMINNVENKDKVFKSANLLKNKGVIDEFYFVADYEEEVLKHFGLTKDSFNGGFYYSIAELTSIYLCKTPYLLHFSGDSFMAHKNNWIVSAIETMSHRPDIFVANAVWNFDFKSAKKEAIEETEDFYIGYGFSDQCYLIKTIDFKNRIYTSKNAYSDQAYPEYGGELFEKRVDAYMRNNSLKRITSKTASYIHENFPYDKSVYTKNAILRTILTKRRLK